MESATLRLVAFRELWIHTGTACNLSCPFCHEGSSPADTRLPALTLAQVAPFLDEAAAQGVGEFAFTGGEPLILREILPVLKHALRLRPVLVLTNGMAPFIRKSHLLAELRQMPHALRFRISIDWPDEARHDAGRGPKSFRKALEGLRLLHSAGFAVGITRQCEVGEQRQAVEARFRSMLRRQQLPDDMPVVSLPNLGLPTTQAIAGHSPASDAGPRATIAPACTRSRMLLRRPEGLRFSPCPLVDDTPGLDMGDTLGAALHAPARLLHTRCRICLERGVDYAGN
ncbi:MAG: hypothetical protein RL030_990 [Pseudomonadota bacterium]|jgi:sulfatase maturation enzyme AslB (radical SAM superfamily)